MQIEKARPLEPEEVLNRLNWGDHPTIVEVRKQVKKIQILAADAINALIDEEAAAWAKIVSNEGQRYHLTPETPNGRDWEDRDAVHFRVEDTRSKAAEAHKRLYGPLADRRHTASSDHQSSVTYYRLKDGRVKWGSGGLLIHKTEDGGGVWNQDLGPWTDEEWHLFKVEGIIPARFR